MGSSPQSRVATIIRRAHEKRHLKTDTITGPPDKKLDPQSLNCGLDSIALSDLGAQFITPSHPKFKRTLIIQPPRHGTSRSPAPKPPGTIPGRHLWRASALHTQRRHESFVTLPLRSQLSVRLLSWRYDARGAASARSPLIYPGFALVSRHASAAPL